MMLMKIDPNSSGLTRIARPSGAVLAILTVLLIALNLIAAQAQGDQRPYIGIQTSITSRGTEVVAVVPGSPGEAGGFKVGDLILSANGVTVLGDTTLESIIGQLKPGTVVKFVILRDGKAIELSVTLGNRPAGPEGSATPSAVPPASDATATGVPTTSGPRPFMGVELVTTADGIQVTKVVPGGPADQAKIQVNDLVIAIDNQQVATTEQSQAILDTKHPGDTVTLTVKRGGSVINIQVKLVERPSQTPDLSAPQATTAAGVPCPPDGPRVQLGVTYEVVTDKVVAERGLKVDYGALVTAVAAKSPADVAGIKVGDVIIEVDGDKVDAKRTLAIRLIPYNVGDTVTLTVMRDADKLTIPVSFVSGGSA